MLNNNFAVISCFIAWLLVFGFMDSIFNGKESQVLAQVPNPNNGISPQDFIEPRTLPFPDPSQPTIPPQENLLDSEPKDNQNDSEKLNNSIQVEKFKFEGNTIFSNEELQKIQVVLSTSSKPVTISSLENERISFQDLVNIAQTVAQFYADQGYRTSGALVILPDEIQPSNNITIKIFEGTLENITVIHSEKNSLGKLGNYVRGRLRVKEEEPLNVDELLEALQLLQLDPLIRSLSAELAPGSERGKNILIVRYDPNKYFNGEVSLENNRSPSIGSFSRGVDFRQDNLLGLGDSLGVGYRNTTGSDRIDGSYRLPINAKNGTISFAFSTTENDVVESPFDDIDGDGETPDIESESETYELTLRQPIIRSINNQTQTFREISLSLTGSFRESQSFVFDTPFPLSPGADEDGFTRVFALRFSQEYTEQNPREIFALRGEFSFGIGGVFDSTVNDEIPGVEEIPDSRFFAWRGQAQYVKFLARDTLFLVRSNIQVANSPLLAIEQFSTGGFGSVRGYRQDELLTDNGFFVSAEVRFPILRLFEGEGVLQVIPFVDYGVGWNNESVDPDPQSLPSIGIGLQYQQGNNITASIEYGLTLADVDSLENTLQENGVLFSLQYNF